MATFTEKILVKIDVAADNASKGLKDFKQSVGQAEGASGKLKAGVSSLGGMFKSAAASPAAMGGAVAAAGAFALKAVDEFSQLGVEVGNFATATGLSTEEASRWIETASDLGIESSGLQSILGKLNKNIDPKLFAQYGIEIAKTASGTTDANQTFLNTIERLHGIQDPAERAQVAAKLLGKSWQGAAELIGMSADDIKKRLNGVSDAKVFTKEEVAKAKAFRDAQADLKDVFEDLVITIGQELAPNLATLAKTIADVAGPLSKLEGASSLVDNGLNKITDGIDGVSRAWDYFFGDDPVKPVENLALGMGHLGELTHNAAKVLGDEFAAKAHDAAYEAAQMRDRVSEAQAKIADLQDQISGSKSLVDLKLGLKDNAKKLADLRDEYAKGKMSAEDYFLKTQQLTLDSQGMVADYAEEVGNIPPEVATNIVATLDPSNPDDIFNTLQRWFDGRKLFVTVEGMIADSSLRNTQEGRGTPPPAGGGGAPAGGGSGRGVDDPTLDRSAVIVNVRTMPTQRELTEFINNTRRRQGPVI